ncbi:MULTISPECIES: S-layer homology domain-containing protein [Brevibacillus]|uniref:SLH domain-containing protein n=2 Tax=Bacillati TaxID=1783272 RepID=M8E5H2_9BACL|nr:S-layer homology domain-containing protein [Brevibacillus borstelensis]EMT50715.1 hypothetical protein I532_20421 [Brevibacillus borstelensis AK1]MBE5396791.1 S-layer homology domain-containing protein [Brevibacillus borstelensis]MCM3471117.1 S-layer homology domain-containing protein [Brevibacillus borstelensis]MCM3559591.1 S-layer homology domain-containing protein [Brevibacillus borstelensis]MCM3624991.1 S-layer homology domain-containing protein [Brevibacillus borstelensis]
MQKKSKVLTCALLVCSLLVPSAASAASSYMPYSDISKHWAKSSIIRGAQYGLFASGGSIERFYPNRELTRAEFVALMDRVFVVGQQHLYPLTFLSEHDEFGKGEGFDEPYLPYKDVDRLTWMYGPTLRMSVLLERLYGPGAIQEIFPGQLFSPNQPITREEAAKLLAIYTMETDQQKAWNMVNEWGWLTGRPSDKLKRGEAAVVFDRLVQFLQRDVMLPLLDYDGQKFPMVPEVQDMFPLFAPYTDQVTGDDQIYVNAAEAIRFHEDSEETFRALRKLAEGTFDNKVGVHYYLSWDPDTEIADNLEHAFKAIDAYFDDRIVLPDTLQLLVANVYDMALQTGSTDPKMYEKILERLNGYEQKIRKNTKESEALAIYQAALEVKVGHMDKALEIYRAFAPHHQEALKNLVYYLVQNEQLSEAEAFLAGLQPKKTEVEIIQLTRLLQQELAIDLEQASIVRDLSFTMGRMENLKGYKAEGEAVLRGFLVKYTEEVDRLSKARHATGIYQSPQKLVLDKWESYTDTEKNIKYERNFDSESWEPSRVDQQEFMSDYVAGMSVKDRARILGARYYKQSFGEYDIITEWIPGDKIVEAAQNVSLNHGKIKSVPVYMNKYYIDSDSDLLVKHVWRYEEVYDTQEYVAYAGEETYKTQVDVRVSIPREVVKGAAR